MNNRIRQISLLIIDTILINLAVYVALLLRFDAPIPESFIQAFIRLIPLFTLVTISFLTGLKLYKRVWEYASIGEVIAIVQATSYSMVVVVMLIYALNLPRLPRTVYIVAWVLMNIAIGASRAWWRLFRGFLFNSNEGSFQRTLVVGAGDAGAILVNEINHNPMLKTKVVGIVDDDPAKQGLIMHGVPIMGTRHDIERLAQQMEIDEIIIAIPSAPGDLVRELMKICWSTTARLKILPGIYQGTRGLVKNLRDVNMEDLLRRRPVETDIQEISGYISGKTIIVTGGGGSIGTELCRQLASLAPESLIVLDCSENNLFEIELELRQDHPDLSVYSELVDIRNKDRLEKVFKKHKPQVIFHAAANKHVPMMERHPIEAFENNIIGTLNVAGLAKTYNSEAFIYISTDKAVNPVSVMGASKRAAELIVKEIGENSNTRFASVRFGNVLGSRGSVVPIIMQQIQRGGPVTVTHPKMRRYFMTISEAVQLVIQAGAMLQGGEIFVLDMGDMVRIDDLARDLIRLAGYEPDRDIKIMYTGIRPGEKIYEELFSHPEEMVITRHKRIFISRKDLEQPGPGILEPLTALASRPLENSSEAIKLLERFVPEYRRFYSNTAPVLEQADDENESNQKRRRDKRMAANASA